MDRLEILKKEEENLQAQRAKNLDDYSQKINALKSEKTKLESELANLKPIFDQAFAEERANIASLKAQAEVLVKSANEKLNAAETARINAAQKLKECDQKSDQLEKDIHVFHVKQSKTEENWAKKDAELKSRENGIEQSKEQLSRWEESLRKKQETLELEFVTQDEAAKKLESFQAQLNAKAEELKQYAEKVGALYQKSVSIKQSCDEDLKDAVSLTELANKKMAEAETKEKEVIALKQALESQLSEIAHLKKTYTDGIETNKKIHQELITKGARI